MVFEVRGSPQTVVNNTALYEAIDTELKQYQSVGNLISTTIEPLADLAVAESDDSESGYMAAFVVLLVLLLLTWAVLAYVYMQSSDEHKDTKEIEMGETLEIGLSETAGAYGETPTLSPAVPKMRYVQSGKSMSGYE